MLHRALRLAMLVAAAHGAAAQAVVYTVNSAADVGDAAENGVCETANGNGVCTLRAAIEEANLGGGNPTILLPALTFELSQGEIVVSAPMTIQGAGPLSTVIQRFAAAPLERFLDHRLGVLALRDLWVRSFVATGGPGQDGGGAVRSWGAGLVVERCIFSSNSAAGRAGAIEFAPVAVGASLVVERSIFYWNQALFGGALGVGYGPTFVRDTIIESNSASEGGAITLGSASDLRVERSMLADNTADRGGALKVYGSAVVVNSTFSGNHARADGGAIHVGGPQQPSLRLYNSTVVGNDANSDQNFAGGKGGGIFVGSGSEAPDVAHLANSILAGNWEWVSDGVCCFEALYRECFGGGLTSNGHNLIQVPWCPVAGGAMNLDPQLAPLAYNGGFTRTAALAPTSPARDGGTPASAGGCFDDLGATVAVDQRGEPRPYGSECDLGAFEWGRLLFAENFEEIQGLGRWSARVP
jgi:hypothetical protein